MLPPPIHGLFNPRTSVGCDASIVEKIRPAVVSIRAPTRGAIHNLNSFIIVKIVSIRAPAWGAMATQSKIRLIRALTTPLSQQNRRILGDPFPRQHPCARPRRENTCRFYDHLGFALEPSFGISHSFVSRLQNFGRPRQTTFLGLPCHPTKRRVRP